MYVCVFHSKKKLCALYGKWTECMYVVDPAAFEAHKKNDKKAAEERKGSKAVYMSLLLWMLQFDDWVSFQGMKSKIMIVTMHVAEKLIYM